jgi:uncharacterized coiled-coil protein SlyX
MTKHRQRDDEQAAVCAPASINPDARPSNTNDDRIAALEAKVAQLTITALEARIAALEAKSAIERQPIRNTVSVTGNFRPHAVARETELISTPETEALRQRSKTRADMAPPVMRFAGKPADSLVPVISARSTGNLCDNSPVFTKPASMSGKTATD